MRKTAYLLALATLAVTTACAKKDENQDTMPADTTTMAPAPMPMDSGMQMDSAAHDSMTMSATTR